MRKIVGVDIGKNGGIACLQDGKLSLLRIPIIGPPGKKTSKVDLSTLKLFILGQTAPPDLVVIESPIAFPGLGVASIGTTFELYGAIQMACVGRARYYPVRPRDWQKVMYAGEPKRKNLKETSAIVAKRLFPGVDFRKTPACRKVHDGFTDAALIAEYGRRLNL